VIGMAVVEEEGMAFTLSVLDTEVVSSVAETLVSLRERGCRY